MKNKTKTELIQIIYGKDAELKKVKETLADNSNEITILQDALDRAFEDLQTKSDLIEEYRKKNTENLDDRAAKFQGLKAAHSVIQSFKPRTEADPATEYARLTGRIEQFLADLIERF